MQVARLPAADAARLGHHNDCFLSDPTDQGTYADTKTPAQWRDSIAAATLTVPLGGETCHPGDLPRFDCPSAVAEMEKLRFTYLSQDWSALTGPPPPDHSEMHTRPTTKTTPSARPLLLLILFVSSRRCWTITQ